MQQALASVDPNLPFASFHTMDELLATALAQQRIEVALLSSLAALALLLAALGIFALVSSVVTDRQREFGIRLALGSPLSDSMLVAGRSGALPAMIGLAAGLALAFVVLRAMRSALFGISSYDPVTLAATVIVLADPGRTGKPAAGLTHLHGFSRRSSCARNSWPSVIRHLNPVTPQARSRVTYAATGSALNRIPAASRNGAPGR